MKDGAELDFSCFQAGEIAVLIEDFSATVAKVIMNFSLHSDDYLIGSTMRFLPWARCASSEKVRALRP